MQQIHKEYAPETADPNGVCLSQTPLAAGDLTIAGALASDGVATFDIPRHVSITAAGDDSTSSFTITGTGRNGVALSEVIAGANATIAIGTKNFKTVTGVAIAAASVGAITVGSSASFDSPVIPVDSGERPFAHSVVQSGTLTHSFVYTMDDVFAADFDESAAGWNENGGEKSADFASTIDTPVTGVRLVVTAVAASASLVLNFLSTRR